MSSTTGIQTDDKFLTIIVLAGAELHRVGEDGRRAYVVHAVRKAAASRAIRWRLARLRSWVVARLSRAIIIGRAERGDGGDFRRLQDHPCERHAVLHRDV